MQGSTLESNMKLDRVDHRFCNRVNMFWDKGCAQCSRTAAVIFVIQFDDNG